MCYEVAAPAVTPTLNLLTSLEQENKDLIVDHAVCPYVPSTSNF